MSRNHEQVLLRRNEAWEREGFRGKGSAVNTSGLKLHPGELALQGVHTGDILPSTVGPAWG